MAADFGVFVTILTGLLLEAMPFLLAGSVASGFVEVFLKREHVEGFARRRLGHHVVFGVLLGMVIPVCECGVIPLARRLLGKGFPAAAAVSFILAAPAINPVTLASTATAFGIGKVFFLRILMTAATSWLVAIVVVRLHPALSREDELPGCVVSGRGVMDALRHAGGDFVEMAGYLVLGAAVAAAMQTVVAREMVLAIGQGPVSSVLAMQALAFVLSLCSTVDSFIALALAGTFKTGALVAFLVFGPMVDIKSTAMLLGTFRRRAVLLMVAACFGLSLLFGVLTNLLVP